MVRTVVFDVGETLIDESRIWLRWAERLGVPPLTFLGVLGGCAALDLSHREAFELLRPGLDFQAEAARWAQDDPDGLRTGFDADDLYPDVRPALAALREAGFHVVVAGNQPPEARAALEAMDLPASAIRTSDEWACRSRSRSSSSRSLSCRAWHPRRSPTWATAWTTTCSPRPTPG